MTSNVAAEDERGGAKPDPNDDDVGRHVVSLVDGPTRFLTQKYGPLSEELAEFTLNEIDHGITRDVSP